MDAKKITAKQVEDVVNTFIDSIDYAIDFSVEEDKENELFKVDMKGENLGALIGFHGKNIMSIEYLLNLMALRKYEATHCITIDINDYKKIRLDNIKSYVDRAIKQIEKNNRPYDLSPMSPYERLFVHELVKQYEGYDTISTGQEPNRYITISPESPLT